MTSSDSDFEPKATGATVAALLLGEGTRTQFTVTGRSMRPFICEGDRVTIAPLGARDPKIGEVIFARLETGTFVVHRVTAIRSLTETHPPIQQVRLSGDHLFGHDHWIAFNSVLGRVEAIERAGQAVPVWKRAALIWYILRPLRHGWARLKN